MIEEKAAGASVLPDRTIAQDLLKDCKFCVFTLSQAITEASHPVVRQFLKTSLSEVIQEQHRIADLMKNKGWYTPYDVSRQLENDQMTAHLLRSQTENSALSIR